MFRSFLPRPREVLLFAVLAVVCVSVISRVTPRSQDLAFAALSFPIFFVAAIMGLRRSPIWIARQENEPEDE
jgi:hypothetical protein